MKKQEHGSDTKVELALSTKETGCFSIEHHPLGPSS